MALPRPDQATLSIYYYHVDKQEQVAADNWEDPGDPLFFDLSGQPDPLNLGVFDFRLQAGSPCLDNGGFRTRTTGQESETTLTVEDAGYFTDGFGVIARPPPRWSRRSTM